MGYYDVVLSEMEMLASEVHTNQIIHAELHNRFSRPQNADSSGLIGLRAGNLASSEGHGKMTSVMHVARSTETLNLLPVCLFTIPRKRKFLDVV